MKRYVLGFAFDMKEKSLLLLAKNRPDWQRGHLNGVGGHIESGETPNDAMTREWAEEIFSDLAEWRLFARLSGDGWECYCYRATIELFNVSSVEDENCLIVKLSKPLPSNIMPNLSWLIPMAQMRNRHDWPFEIREMASIDMG